MHHLFTFKSSGQLFIDWPAGGNLPAIKDASGSFPNVFGPVRNLPSTVPTYIVRQALTGPNVHVLRSFQDHETGMHGMPRRFSHRFTTGAQPLFSFPIEAAIPLILP